MSRYFLIGENTLQSLREALEYAYDSGDHHLILGQAIDTCTDILARDGLTEAQLRAMQNVFRTRRR